jgi:hypothetical protein
MIYFISKRQILGHVYLFHPNSPKQITIFSLFRTVNLRKLAGAPGGCAPGPLLQISPNSHGRIWTSGNPRQICPAKQVSRLFHATLRQGPRDALRLVASRANGIFKTLFVTFLMIFYIDYVYGTRTTTTTTTTNGNHHPPSSQQQH